LLIRNREQLWLPSPSLLEGGIDIPACSQSNNFEAFGIGFNDAQRAAAYRTGRAQDGNTFHDTKFENHKGHEGKH
jgi:hypothetical protein